MRTDCLAIRNESFLTSYSYPGVSGDTTAIASKEKEIQEEALSGSMSIGYTHMFQTLVKAFEEYSVDNWDAYGAKAVDVNSFVDSMRFSRMLPTTIPIPDIYVDANGEFIFEWHCEKRRVMSVIVEGNNRLVYSGIFGVNKTNGVEYFVEELPKAIMDNLQRLLA